MSIQAEKPKDTQADAIGVLKRATEKLEKGDVGAHFEEEVIQAAILIKQNNMPEFMRIKQALKKAHKDSQIASWEKQLKNDNNSSTEDTSQAGELVSLVNESAELFHNDANECFITIVKEAHYENWQIGSGGFKDWLSYEAYTKLGFCPNEQAIKQAMITLTGMAKFDNPELAVYMRCAPYKGGYVIDLTDEEWRAVQVDATGYTLLTESPVKFIRSNTVAPLPSPTTPDLSLLWKYVNIFGSDRLLLLAFMLESWRTNTPFVLLGLIGAAGSGKSSAHKAIRAVTDPNTTPLRSAPKDVRDVRVSAQNNWQASFENMSYLPDALQDSLCCLLTGGGSAERALYSNKDESVFSAMCPVILNGIENVITRPDLIDRTIVLNIPEIEAHNKKTEAVIASEFKEDAPKIFAGLLSLFSKSLQQLPNIKIDMPQRMVDFTYLGEAMLSVLKSDSLILNNVTTLSSVTSFNTLYAVNRKNSLDEAINASPATLALVEFIYDQDSTGFKGTIKKLKTCLELHKYMRHGEGWPKSERGLTSVLKRMAPALKVNGIGVDFLGHQRDGTHVYIYTLSQNKLSQNNRHNRHTVTDGIKSRGNSIVV